METKLEKISNLERKLTLSISKEEMVDKIQKRLHEITGQVKMEGFRPGKVPFSVVQKKYQKNITEEVFKREISTSFRSFIEREQLNLAGPPDIVPVPFKFGEPLQYTAMFELLPEIKLIDFKEVEVSKLKVDLTPEDIEHSLLVLRKKFATWSDKEDQIASENDRVVVDYKVTHREKILDRYSVENQEIDLDKKIARGLLINFVESLCGAKVGDEVRVRINYDKDFYEKDLAGKEVEFIIKVKKVLKPTLPTLDEKFAQEKLGLGAGGEKEIRAKVEEIVKRELDQEIKKRFQNDLLRELLKLHSIDLPKVLVARELFNYRENEKQQKKYYGENYGESSEEELLKAAQNRVMIKLLLNEVVKTFDLKVDEKRLNDQIEGLKSFFPKAKGSKALSLEQIRYLESTILEEQALEMIEKQIKIKNQSVSYKDFWK